MNKSFWVVLTVLLGLLAIIFGPIVIIWAMNTLFNFSIEYNFNNWLATIILSATIRGTAKITGNND